MNQAPLGTMAVAAGVDETSALVIVIAAALAGLIVLALSPRLTIPVVVVELVLGIVIGPQGFDIARIDPTTSLLGDLGLGMLFFFAGYEIDFDRIKGRPLELALLGWALSLALAYGIGGVLAAVGIILSFLYTGSAMATTAIGTLIPILSDAGEMRTRFGTYLLGAGAIGEFGPILLVTLILSTGHPLHEWPSHPGRAHGQETGDHCQGDEQHEDHGLVQRVPGGEDQGHQQDRSELADRARAEQVGPEPRPHLARVAEDRNQRPDCRRRHR